uniref:Vitellogenin receptor-2 n=1 Tax=Pardosa pseudoannulata TaxID=330961 RepID=A0A8G0YHU0_9ARAC|nr:vitellogenin receptor-2 [Pardosa pseudoannulata]
MILLTLTLFLSVKTCLSIGNTCENLFCSQKCEETPFGPQCFCEYGYVLDKKDNRTCNDIDECSQEGFCSQKCDNIRGSFKCSCHNGYELIGRSCKVKGPSPLLIMSTMRDIRGIRLKSGQYFPITKAVHKALAVDIDPNSQTIYWIEISHRSSIYSVRLDGSAFKTVLSHGLLVPEDIAVDYIASNLYITDSGLRQVLACKMEGTLCHVLHYKNVEKPRSIVLDLMEGFVYWSDWGENVVGIYRSGMDGSRRIPLVTKRIEWPNSIAIDRTTNRLYWADTKLNSIEYISLDKSSRKTILNASAFHPYSLAVFEDTIYWTDKHTFSLESCNKFTGYNVSLIDRENGRDIRSVHVYHPVLTAKVSNPCRSNNCSHMCLISPQTGYRCACPQGFRLSSGDKLCIMKENSDSLFWSEGSTVYHIRPESVGSHSVTELPLFLNSVIIKGISYDTKSKSLFISDVKTPAIHAVNLTSLQIRELVKNHITSPASLSFDYKTNNLYWMDSSKGTVEVLSVESLKRVTVLTDLANPVDLATSPSQGYMFIAENGAQATLAMYDMDGKNKKVLNPVQGTPMSIALHPSKSVLYWADPKQGTISYINFRTGTTNIIRSKIEEVTSVAASEENVYWTTKKSEINLLKGNMTYILQLPNQEKISLNSKATYISGKEVKEKSNCRTDNGGCSYICLTSPNGRTCSCPTNQILAEDDKTCVERRCSVTDFRCMSIDRCLSIDLRCDGKKDCEDGSDEFECGTRCPGDDFQCKNGRCILKSWQCDNRDDCKDNSDEENCPEEGVCTKDKVPCSDGHCISVLWRCDGEADCADSMDEQFCDSTRCDTENMFRCDQGQCVPISWVCDGTADCKDGTDERNCSKETCSHNEFRCETDGACVGEHLRCDKRADCTDGSDEINCSDCIKGMYKCNDGSCIYVYEVCDGYKDCNDGEDELYCSCRPNDLLCQPTNRCTPLSKICDGHPDCSDGSDEKNCKESRKQPLRPRSKVRASECDEFFCYATGHCLPWSKVCDGFPDCPNIPDEGGRCQRACSGDNGGCSQICKKSPQGPQCICLKGYRLQSDNKRCEDINECLEPGTCSHFCNNTKGGFKCSCAEGYYLQEDRLCKADGGPAILVYVLVNQIRSFELVTHTQRVYINLTNADIRGMDYDASEMIFYWTEFNDGSINSHSPNTQRENIIVRTSSKPIYIKYDWITKNLYYSDLESRIGVCSKDGRFCTILIKTHGTSLDSIDLSPTTGYMFWTAWITSDHQASGVIERAEMDGSNQMIIVSENTRRPTSVTVDHVLHVIYWTDPKLQTLEMANFDGTKRRRIIQYDMDFPYAMTVFEDYVYWADWGNDIIVKCEKFTGKDCSQIKKNDVKAQVLLIVHKIMQPKGINKCENSDCPHLCLLTHSNHVCACAEGYFLKNGNCELKPPVTTSTSPSSTKCPETFCTKGVECVVEDGNYVCKCPETLTGERCEKIVDSPQPKGYDYSWFVFIALAVLIIEIIILISCCCTERFRNIKKKLIKRYKGMCVAC